MTFRFVPAVLGMGVLFMLAGFEAAAASEIKVFSTPTMKTAIDELRPLFEQMSGHTLIVVFEESFQVASPSLEC